MYLCKKFILKDFINYLFMKQFICLCITVLSLGTLQMAAQNGKGYYKDLFIDGGINISSYKNLPSAHFLDLKTEAFLCSPQKTNGKSFYNAVDTLTQRQVFGGSPLDENGVLLYPDGAPRFRLLYTNGGSAARHGRSMGNVVRERIREYIKNGGSYLGSCAGAFIGSRAVKGDDSLKYLDAYYGIWPGLTISTGIVTSQTTVTFDEGSPLLKYYDFGGDYKLDSLYHNGGGFAVTDTLWPEETEVLARYDVAGRTDLKLKRNIQGLPAIWAYKPNAQSGRVILCGSHPELNKTGEKLELMCTMVRYALDGNGTPILKGELENGKERQMYCFTHDNNPDYTAIGDKQYHHFVLNIPKDTKKVTLRLTPKPGYTNFDMYLLAQPEKFAFLGEAAFKALGSGCEKKLVIDNPKEGRMFVSVFCDTTIETRQTNYGTQYTGCLEVLNGVPYSITAEF